MLLLKHSLPPLTMYYREEFTFRVKVSHFREYQTVEVSQVFKFMCVYVDISSFCSHIRISQNYKNGQCWHYMQLTYVIRPWLGMFRYEVPWYIDIWLVTLSDYYNIYSTPIGHIEFYIIQLLHKKYLKNISKVRSHVACTFPYKTPFIYLYPMFTIRLDKSISAWSCLL